MSQQQQDEIATKIQRIVAMLQAGRHDAVVIRRNENLAWITAGVLDRRVELASNTNVCSVVITRQGERFYLAPENEAARLADEDFTNLGFAALTWPWTEDGLPDALAKIAPAGSFVADHPTGAAPVVELTALRTPLLATEQQRYRELGKQVADIVSRLLHRLQPGIAEFEMQAQAASALWTAGIEPSVLLMAVDDRILKYKHAVAHGDVLRHYGMLNLCARKAGLAVSITRFVHFGPMPQPLADGFAAAAEVNAALQAASLPGASAADLYAVAKDAYAKAGFPDEEEKHHQGGPAGYFERDWVATPGGRQQLVNAQALAWNPSCRGGKVEDTMLLVNGEQQLLTPTPALPMVSTRCGSRTYTSAGVLIR